MVLVPWYVHVYLYTSSYGMAIADVDVVHHHGTNGTMVRTYPDTVPFSNQKVVT